MISIGWQTYYDAAKKCHDLAGDISGALGSLISVGSEKGGPIDNAGMLVNALTRFGDVLAAQGYNWGVSNNSAPDKPVETNLPYRPVGGSSADSEDMAAAYSAFAKSATVTGAPARINSIISVLTEMKDANSSRNIEHLVTLRQGVESAAAASLQSGSTTPPASDMTVPVSVGSSPESGANTAVAAVVSLPIVLVSNDTGPATPEIQFVNENRCGEEQEWSFSEGCHPIYRYEVIVLKVTANYTPPGADPYTSCTAASDGVTCRLDKKVDVSRTVTKTKGFSVDATIGALKASGKIDESVANAKTISIGESGTNSTPLKNGETFYAYATYTRVEYEVVRYEIKSGEFHSREYKEALFPDGSSYRVAQTGDSRFPGYGPGLLDVPQPPTPFPSGRVE